MWYQERPEGVLVTVKVIPHSRINSVAGVVGDFLKVKIHAAPEKGRANDALVEFFAGMFNIQKRQVLFVRGKATPLKLIFLPIATALLLSQVENPKSNYSTVRTKRK